MPTKSPAKDIKNKRAARGRFFLRGRPPQETSPPPPRDREQFFGFAELLPTNKPNYKDMNSYTFEASFNEMAARLKEMQQERPGSRGFIYAKIRGRVCPVDIAEAAPGGKLQKQFNVTDYGLMILRPNYIELVPYGGIYAISASIYSGTAED